MKDKLKILIPQPEPQNCSPYSEVINRYNAEIDFIPFFRVKPVDAKHFKDQKLDLEKFTAIVFTSRTTIDAFFNLCKELKIDIDDDFKYFCSSEAIALYLQKYIVYRKRKIFFGTGTPLSIIDAIGNKHKEEKFLLTVTDNSNSKLSKLFTKSKLNHSSAVLIKTEVCNLAKVDIDKYDVVVFYSPTDVKSFKKNFPKFNQKKIEFATFGDATRKALKRAKYEADIVAPTPEAPSIARALFLHFGQKASS